MARVDFGTKIVGEVKLIYDALIKGLLYSLIAYPFLENWYSAIISRARPLLLQNRDKDAVILKLRREVKAGWLIRGILRILNRNFSIPEQKPKNKTISILYRGRRINFVITESRELEELLLIITEQFLEEQYSWLDTKRKYVIDIGGGMGDASIYFVLKRARKIFLFEPSPYFYAITNMNVSKNRMKNRIRVINEAVGGKAGKIFWNLGFDFGGKSQLRNTKNGKEIHITTLESITKRFKMEDAALKIDCEGSEYDIILKAKNSTLRNFTQIMIEYHFGFQTLEKKLISAGFRVRHSTPTYFTLPNLGTYLYGHIFAERL